MIRLRVLSGLFFASVWAYSAQADCGLQCGGCSDPCVAAACGGYGVSACASCSGHNIGGSSAVVSSGTGCSSCGTIANVPTQQSRIVDCGPVTSYKVVLEPKYVTETRAQCVTEYRDEVRYRTRTIPRQVAVEVQDFRTSTVMVPKTETKTIEYSVLVPKTGEKTVTVTETVPVWNETEQSYTVRVPHVVDVPEQYTVRVPKLQDEQFTYTVYVPQAQTETRTQAVTNAVPVTRTRQVQICRPVTKMQSVTKDYGHWEVRVEEAAVVAPVQPAPCSTGSYRTQINMGGCDTYQSSGCGGCSSVTACGNSCGRAGCGAQVSVTSGCGTPSCSSCGTAGGVSNGCATIAPRTTTRRVWVPNVITEQVPVVESVTETQEVSYTAFETKTEQVPYECTFVVYAPETRSGVRKVVNYENETRTRTRKIVEYKDETRTRKLRELSYKQETRDETVPFVTYETEKRTKQVEYTVTVPETKVEPITTTRYDTVNEEITEQYVVRVPVQTTREVSVQVCRMVPKLVPVTIYPCSQSVMASAEQGCSSCGGARHTGSVGCSACGSTNSAAAPCTACGQ